MIFLCGIPTKPSLVLVVQQVQVRPASCAVQPASLRRPGAGVPGDRRPTSGLVVDGNGGYRLEHFTGIYTRLMNSELLPEVEKKPSIQPNGCTARQCTMCWHMVRDCAGRVLNRMEVVGSNLSKPYQAQIIRRHGFATPRHWS